MDRAFLEQVAPALAGAGIHLSSWNELDDDDEKFLVETFEDRIFPVLTPLAVDPGHPFPYISSLSLNLAVVVRDPVLDEQRFARVKVPDILPRFVVLPDGERFIPLEQVIAAHLDQLFPGMEIEEHHPFRVTRNADLTLEEEEADDLLAAVEIELRRRRFGRAVRLEIDAGMSPEVRALLQRELDVGDDDVYVATGPLDLGGLWAVHGLDRPDLKDAPYVRVTPARLGLDEDERADVFGAARRGDLLLHHPYESFRTSVEEFVRQAAYRPQRAGHQDHALPHLGRQPHRRATSSGRPSGASRWRPSSSSRPDSTRAPTSSGPRRWRPRASHVAYGLVGLKVHSKCAARRARRGRRPAPLLPHRHRQLQLQDRPPLRGPGPASPPTPRSATTSPSSSTSSPATAATSSYRRLLVAPRTLRPGLVDLIRGRGRGRPERGRIIMKMNSLVDPAMIDELYAASQARACDRPDHPGHLLPAPGRARPVGEHPGALDRRVATSSTPASTTSPTAAGDGEPRYLIGSADLMPRNLDRRVEALVPVIDPELTAAPAGDARRRAGRRRAGLEPRRRRPVGAGAARGVHRDPPRAAGPHRQPQRRLTVA